ncbi:hypothetical protein EC991_006255 [Linnemannia zychae]|nr:hypothetical protein EC991_006255 [Linnemannia zychae]
MTPDPHPPVMSDDDYSDDDDFESASEGEQERDSATELPAKAFASVMEPAQHRQQQAPLQQTPPTQSSLPQQTQQQQRISQEPLPLQQRQQEQQQQKPWPSMSTLPHPSTESESSPLLESKRKLATAEVVTTPSPHASIDSPPARMPTRVQEHTLSRNKLDKVHGSMSPPNTTPGYPKQFATSGLPFEPPSPSLAAKPPLAPSFSGKQQQQQPSRPQQQLFGSSQSHAPVSNQYQSGARQTDPNLHGRNKLQQESGRGWGSLGSWINTAVSTVSEVIENPNVVVSKAHTIGQGIRNVATEQIDRVYESLDPEYEYERERQKQQQPSQWHMQHHTQQGQHIQTQHHQLRHDEFVSQSSSGPVSQSKKEPRKDDISDLLQSTEESRQHSLPSNSNTNKNGVPHKDPSQGKLAYNENTVDSTDAWGDDAWGDDWDDQAGIDNVETITEPSPTVKQPTVPTQPAIPQPSDKPQERQAYDLQRQPADRQQDALRPPSRTGQVPPESRKNVKDLFNSPRSGSFSQGQESRAASNLSVPLSANSSSGELPSQRRPSADLRPAEALFSTLDFASNAIGSAVLGVHRKVTQVGQTQQQKNSGLDFQPARSASPAWSTPQRRESGDSGKEVSEKMDRLALSNPTLEAVGGNVVSTGLGALEILGKRAVDVISDVRRAGHLSHGQGGPSDVFDEQNSFKVPTRMNIATMFEESGSKAHLVSLRSLASAAATRVNVITASRPDFLNAGQLDDLEQLLDYHALDNVAKEPTADLLAGHKDFRAMVALLEQMGVQGTTYLRQLRNCTRKLSTLVPDNVNAFEQEWHNRQTRASEKDFFARGSIKKFFESRLLTVYFDGLRALAQFTDKTCDQTLRLAENFNIRVAEKSSSGSSPSSDDDGVSGLATLALAKIFQQFVGSLIAETKFISKQYRLSLDAILRTAKGLTTPLDNLDWEDLTMGLDKIKILLTDTETIEAIGFVHSGAHCVLEVLRNDLMIDFAYGKVTPTPCKPRSRPAVSVKATSPAPVASISRPVSKPSPPSSTSSSTSGTGRRPSATSTEQGVGLSSPRMSPSPRIPPMNRSSPSPSLKPSPGIQAGQPRPSFSPSLRPATVTQPGQLRSSPSPSLRPSPSPSLRPVQQLNPQGQSQGISSRLAPSPSLRPAQAIGQPRPPMVTRPKTPVSQPSSAVPGRSSSTSGGTPPNSNPHSYSLYPRPPPVQRPPVKEEEDFFSMLNGS